MKQIDLIGPLSIVKNLPYQLLLKIPGDLRQSLFRGVIKRSPAAPTPLAEFRFDFPSYDANNHITTIEAFLTSEQTNVLDELLTASGVYDIVVTQGMIGIRPLLRGWVEAVQLVTPITGSGRAERKNAVLTFPEANEIEIDSLQSESTIPGLPASKIVRGVLQDARIPASIVRQKDLQRQIAALLEGAIDPEHSHPLASPERAGFLSPELFVKLEALQPPEEIDGIDSVPGLTQALAGKAPELHNHELSEINGLAAIIAANAVTSQTVSNLSQAVTALQQALAGKADTDHIHAIAQIVGLTTVLNDLQAQINERIVTDADLVALAAVATQPFGLSLLTLANLPAAKALLEIPASGGGGGAPTASELTYSISQSSIAATSSALTVAVLTDNNTTTGGGTNTSGANWIKADLGSPKIIERLTVAGGTVPNYGTVAGALNNRLVQVSLDDAVWTTLFTLSDVTNSGSSTFVLPTSKARYLRIFVSSGGVGSTEFRLFGY